jgi:hydroxymethylpyrimidine pyrophosphatase-like HAD family hydrolase
VKLRALALDYDGTIARDGILDADVRRAISTARADGVAVVLATGRILDDLRGLVGDLSLFDAIVAENGAVIAFPSAGRSSQVAPAPTSVFLAELSHRGLAYRAGSCVVELSADAAEAVLRVVRQLELPLTLHFNRGHLMVLPPAVSKATGLREALRTLRLSAHNTIGIGDAENDYELLAACELGVAVAWGSRALQQVADRVLPGPGPSAVAPFLVAATREGRIAPAATPRRTLLLGRDEFGAAVSLAVRGRNVLIAGDPRSGKSWVGGLLCEQLVVQQYCTCVIDPEGDYGELEALPGVVVLGKDREASLAELARTLRHADVSVVMDLSGLVGDAKHDRVLGALRLLTQLRRDTGLPHRVVVDEAHYFLHDSAEAAAIDLELGGYTLLTYRIAGLQRDVLRSAECVIVTRETDAAEARLLHETFGGGGDAERWVATLSSLKLDEAVLLPVSEESYGLLRRFHLAPRLTRHVRHRSKYLDVPTTGARSFRFRLEGGPGPVVASLGELVRVLARTPVAAFVEHVQRGDLSRWIAEVLADATLASAVRAVEEQYCLGRQPDFNDAVIRAVHDRYGEAELLA